MPAAVRALLSILLPILVVATLATAEAAAPEARRETASVPAEGPGQSLGDCTVAIDWPDYRAEARLSVGPASDLRYRLERLDGSVELLTPDEFARRSLEHGLAGPRSPLERLFNTSGPIGILWVLFGLAGQAVFAGRMVVQWLVSERKRESVVPPVFWWMSLVGSAMLLSYFLWRHDIVGILGQSLGFVIYVRNLMLIRRAKLRSTPEAEPTLA